MLLKLLELTRTSYTVAINPNELQNAIDRE